MKFIFIINRYRYRKLAFNNFLKIKSINGYRIINLSGPFISWLGYLLYKFNFSNKFKFISCDGWPFLSNEKNSVNIWFGGTILKIPKTLSNYKNNYVTASTLFTKTNKHIQFYPFKIKERKNILCPKIIIALSFDHVNNPFVLDFWNKNKKKILSNLSILENEKFWKSAKINDLDMKKKHSFYISIKSLLRIELISIIKKKFKNLCVVIGNDMKSYFPDALSSNFKHGYLKNLYDGNICLDFLAKDGDQILYPRSIEILENGGTLFQVEGIHSRKLFEKYKDDLTFNSSDEMIEKLERLTKHEQLNIFNNFFKKKFNTINYNQKTFKKIFT